MVIKGYETLSMNVVPYLQPTENDEDADYSNGEIIKTKFDKLCKTKEKLLDLYHTEFLGNLVKQAVDKQDRYRPVPHEKIEPGDICLLIEKHTKRYLFPMARVLSVEVNSLNEVTAAKLIKGDTREVVYRHVNSLILLIPCGRENNPSLQGPQLSSDSNRCGAGTGNQDNGIQDDSTAGEATTQDDFQSLGQGISPKSLSCIGQSTINNGGVKGQSLRASSREAAVNCRKFISALVKGDLA